MNRNGAGSCVRLRVAASILLLSAAMASWSWGQEQEIPVRPGVVIRGGGAPASLPAIDAALVKPFSDVQFGAGTGLEDAIEFLRQASGLNFHVRWKRLEVAGVKKDAPVALDLKKTNLDQVITKTLSAAGEMKLAWTVDRDVIIISTKEDIRARLVVSSLPPAEPEMRAKLEKLVPKLEFDAIPAETALDFIRQALGPGVQVRWEKIDSVDIRQTPITVTVRGVSVDQAIRLVLDELPDAGYYIGEGLLVITTRADAEEHRKPVRTQPATTAASAPAKGK